LLVPDFLLSAVIQWDKSCCPRHAAFIGRRSLLPLSQSLSCHTTDSFTVTRVWGDLS